MPNRLWRGRSILVVADLMPCRAVELWLVLCDVPQRSNGRIEVLVVLGPDADDHQDNLLQRDGGHLMPMTRVRADATLSALRGHVA